MSGDYSSFERDYFKKQKRREDSKSSKISPKEIKVYEPKSAQKSIKTQGYADESDPSSCYEYSYYTGYTKSAKKKNEVSYTFQARSSPKTNNRGNNKSKALRKDEERDRDNEDVHKDKSFKLDVIWVPASKAKAPSSLDEQSIKPKHSNPAALSSELERPLREDSSIISTGPSVAVTRDDRKSIELFNFLQDRPDPIQILKANREKERQRKVESTENISGIEEEKSLESQVKTRATQNRREFDEDNEINEQEENYSDIDNMVEEKLLNNQIEPEYEDIVFNEEEPEPRETLEALDDKERPEWEDIDAQQVLKEIKTSNNLDMFSQRIMIPNNNKQQEEPQLKEADKEDYFDKIFFSEIREEPMAVLPGLFKFSSDKQPPRPPQERCLDRANSACSRSFDLELIDHGNYKPLPAFRNFRIQKGINSDSPTKEVQNHPLVIETPENYANPNSTYSSQRVFCKLIPNPHAKVWHYRDLEGIIQGPYSSHMMDSWYNKGYLPLELDVTVSNSRGFRKIRDLVEIASSIQNSVLLTSAPNRNNAPTHVKQGNYQSVKVNQDENDLDETQNEINNSIENIISENCCPNVNYNFTQNGTANASLPYGFKNFKESDRLHFDCSVNKPYQVQQNNNQFQGFDYNRNYLRNLPR